MPTGLFIVIFMFVSTALGIGIGYIWFHQKDPEQPVGTLMVSTDDPDGPYIFLELDVPPIALAKKRKVTLAVKHLKTNSRK